jgi:RNase P/RNase MRP subunit POP5
VIREHKKRYMGFYIPSPTHLTKHQLLSRLMDKLPPTPRPRVRIIEYNAASGVGILLCDHKSLPQLRQVFHKFSKISVTLDPIYLLGVSGTLKTLRQKFLNTKYAQLYRYEKPFSRND